jgi:integrase
LITPFIISQFLYTAEAIENGEKDEMTKELTLWEWDEERGETVEGVLVEEGDGGVVSTPYGEGAPEQASVLSPEPDQGDARAVDAALALAVVAPAHEKNQTFFASIVPHAPQRAPEQNAAMVYLARLAPNSRRSMETALNVLVEIFTNGQDATLNAYNFEWGQLRYSHCTAVRAILDERYNVNSANHRLGALRGVLKVAWKLGQMDTDDYHRAISFEPIRGTVLPRGRALSAGEVRAIFSVCSADAMGVDLSAPVVVSKPRKRGKSREEEVEEELLHLSPSEVAEPEPEPRQVDINKARAKVLRGKRDQALLAVLYGVGVRRFEAVALQLSDYNEEDSTLIVRAGKGNKADILPVPPGAKSALSLWIDERGNEPGALFIRVWPNGRMEMGDLSPQTVYDVLVERAAQCGVRHVAPHDIRRTYISDLLEAGADISTVQKLARHANVQTTILYDRRDEKAKKKAADLIQVPEGAPRNRFVV